MLVVRHNYYEYFFAFEQITSCLIDLLERIDLDTLSYELRHKANTETSKQRKNEALKRLNVVEAFRDSQKTWTSGFLLNFKIVIF